MIEKQTINGKDVWLKVNPHPIKRDNPNIIPTEYFTATYYLEEPADTPIEGATINDEDGGPRLFESPVAALSYAVKKLQSTL